MSRDKNERSIKRAVKRSKKEIKSHYGRAKLNHQNPRTGKQRRPAKKQGCISMTAIAVLGVGATVAGVVLTVKGLA